MYYEQKIKKKGQKGGGKVELNDMDSISSLINNFTGGGGIESLGNIDKISGLLGSKGLGSGSSRFPLLLIIIIILLFSNRGCGGSMNCPQYCCRSCSRKGRKHRRKYCCQSCGYGGCGGYGGGGCGSYGGCGSSLIIIIAVLFLLSCGKDGGLNLGALSSLGSMFNLNRTEDTETTEANEEE